MSHPLMAARLRRGLLFLLLSALIPAAYPVSAQTDSNEAKLLLYDKIRSCSVKIVSTFDDKRLHGSGVAIERWNAYVLIVTNAHVVADEGAVCPSIAVKPWSRTEDVRLPAYLLYRVLDARTFLDVAFLIVKDAARKIAVAEVVERDADADWRASAVYSCGNPHEEEFLVDHGHILPNPTRPGSEDANRTKYVLFHDAMVEHGNSGGGLFNGKGELVGLNTWLMDDKKTGMAIDFERFSKYFGWGSNADSQPHGVRAQSDDWNSGFFLFRASAVHMLAVGTWTLDRYSNPVDAAGFSAPNDRALYPKFNYGSLLAEWSAYDPARRLTVRSDPQPFNRTFAGPGGVPILYKDARIASLAVPEPPPLAPAPIVHGKPIARVPAMTFVDFRVNSLGASGNRGSIDVFWVVVTERAGIGDIQ